MDEEDSWIFIAAIEIQLGFIASCVFKKWSDIDSLHFIGAPTRPVLDTMKLFFLTLLTFFFIIAINQNTMEAAGVVKHAPHRCQSRECKTNSDCGGPGCICMKDWGFCKTDWE